MSLAGNLCSIFGSLFYIFPVPFFLGYTEIFIGIGAFCTWCSIVKYLANTEDFYVISRTFNQALPLLTHVWIGILPVYIGVSLLSMCVMWEFKDSFGGLASSLYLMFSI